MAWTRVKAILKDRLPDSTYRLWIESLACEREADNRLVLVCPDRFSLNWIADNYLPLMREAAGQAGWSGEIRLEVAQAVPEGTAAGPVQPCLPTMAPGRAQIRTLNPRYTFEQFVVGSCNALAFSACRAIASGDQAYGPSLYLEAGTGLGKTHLAQAVTHHLLQHDPGARLIYTTVGQFSQEVVEGVRGSGLEGVKDKYRRQCDVLVLEGIDRLPGKERTQTELNDTLDALLANGKRVILTGSQSPRDIPGLHTTFRSRLAAGLVTSINPPDAATRCLIVKRKCAYVSLELSEELAAYLAENLRGDIRQVESAVVGLRARVDLAGRAPDRQMVQELVADLVGRTPLVTVEAIRAYISRAYRVPVTELQSKTRKREVAFPRQVGMYLARRLTDQGLVAIGKAFNRDHSTVVHAVKTVGDLVRRDGRVRAEIEHLVERLGRDLG
ncbi:MAG: chromosomal replication initiator protein DnaA [Thermodesulfobacteriota bacterium]